MTMSKFFNQRFTVDNYRIRPFSIEKHSLITLSDFKYILNNIQRIPQKFIDTYVINKFDTDFTDHDIWQIQNWQIQSICKNDIVLTYKDLDIPLSIKLQHYIMDWGWHIDFFNHQDLIDNWQDEAINYDFDFNSIHIIINYKPLYSDIIKEIPYLIN